MKKKMLIFLGAVLVLFAALYFVVDYKNKQAVETNENPYNKEKLHQETIDQLDDPLYQNQVTPGELNEMLENKEDAVVYFYSPTCSHCQKTTPVLVPLAEDNDIDLKKLNLLEYEEEFQTYEIEGTPTVVVYKDGEEVDRISGSVPKDAFQYFFRTNDLLSNNKEEAN